MSRTNEKQRLTQPVGRAAIILVDYARQVRLKILGHVEIFEGRKAEPWLARVRVEGYKAIVERFYVIHIEAYDWNCPQHITPRYTAEEIREGMHDIEERVQNFEQENKALRKKLEQLQSR